MFKYVVKSLNTTYVNNLSLAFWDKKQSTDVKQRDCHHCW